jgi:hypothetical protein
MAKKLTRREFVQSTTTAGLAVAGSRSVFGQAPAVRTTSVKPVGIASSNGNRYKHGGPVTGVQKAFEMMTKGSDVLDSLIAAVNLCELDPEDSNMGFTIEDDLNTERSRRMWLEWKRRIDPDHYLDPKKRGEAGLIAGLSMVRDGLIDPEHFYGTINCDGVNSKGEVCGVTTTSGLSWKIPGRVGDSPILGAGLYVDGEIGAAGSTGRGEANLYNLCSFLIVEEMRRGKHPKDAALEACRRVQKNTVEKRLLNARGLPNFGLTFYVLNAKGEYAGVSLYEANYAVCTENGPQTLPTTPLLEGKSSD